MFRNKPVAVQTDVFREKPGAGSIALTVLALLLLNAALSFKEWWPTPGVLPDHRIAPEFVWLWVLLLITIAWRQPLGPWALRGFTLAYLTLMLGRYIDVTAPSLFGRPVNFYWDGLQIPRFLWVSAQERPGWQVALILAAVALLFFTLYRAVRWAIGRVAREAVPYALHHRWTWALTLAAVALSVANHAGVRATWPVVSKPVIPTYWRQAQLLVTALQPRRIDEVLPARTSIDQALEQADALAALRGRDVAMILLESVGAIVVDNPRAKAALQPVREQFEADVRASGRGVVSAWFTSPTFAGGSDLAHLSLLSAMDLSDPFRHDLLLTTQRPTLNTLFSRRGYQTVGFYPSVFWEWPERAFYAFDRYVDGRDLAYPGPELGFWKIPDQYSMARIEQLMPREAGTSPRFLFFPTITSHLPFSPVPPFQPDWSKLLSGQPFAGTDLERALAERPNWLEMFPDYLRMVTYAYRWLGDYFRQPEPRETIYLLIGDHQPAANVSGESASWDVPVHIVSSDPELLARWRALGFEDGMTPTRRSLGPLHKVTDMMLQTFSGSRP
ncbi:MAG: sulfatase-like hydrolase/transferase [Burkholderiales bacterium]